MRTRTPGRPKSPATTALVGALIAKQDAMSARTATRINDFLAEHIPAALVESSWYHHVTRARRHLQEIAARAQRRIPHLTDQDVACLAQLVDEALEELGSPAPPRGPMPPREPAAEVHRSTCLAEARGQCARLQARWINLRQRVRKEKAR